MQQKSLNYVTVLEGLEHSRVKKVSLTEMIMCILRTEFHFLITPFIFILPFEETDFAIFVSLSNCFISLILYSKNVIYFHFASG